MARNRYLSYWKKFFKARTNEIIDFLRERNSPDIEKVQAELESDFNTALERYTYSTDKVREWKTEIKDLKLAVEMFQSAKDDFESALRSSVTKWKHMLKVD
jgi:hypothetical protein